MTHDTGGPNTISASRDPPNTCSRHSCMKCLPRLDQSSTRFQSHWQHAAVPAWCPVPPTTVCEVAYTLLDNGRWLRLPARFLRWRPDRSPEDCWLDQLAEH